MLTKFFKRSNEGTTIVEFAIVAPVLFLLLIGMIEVGLVMFASSILESATEIGGRIGKTGYTTNEPREDYIRDQIQRLSGGFLDKSKLVIEMTSYNDFSDVGKAGKGTKGAGKGGDVTIYRATYPWTLFTPMMAQLLGDTDGNLHLTAVAAVRNEPFQ